LKGTGRMTMSIRHRLLTVSVFALAFAIQAPSMLAHADPFLVEESVISACCGISASPSLFQAGGRLEGTDFSFVGGGFFNLTGGPTGRFFALGEPINLSGLLFPSPDLTVRLHAINWITAGGQLNFHVPSTQDVQLSGNQFRIPAQPFSMTGLIAADSLRSPQRFNLSVAGIGTAIALGRIISDPGDPNHGKLEVTTIQYGFSTPLIPEPSTWLLLATGLVTLLLSKKQFIS
jgi:hypothetical protein